MGNGERQKRVSLREVAQKAEVSLGTASSVFTGKSWVSTETANAVRKAAQELGYQPRVTSIQQRQVTSLGLVIRGMLHPLPTNPFYASILHGAEQACAARDIGLMYAIVDENAIRIEDLPVMVQRELVQGLLVSGYFDPEFFTLLQRIGMPFMLIDHYVHDLPTDSVNPDDEYGGYLATRYLLEQGHRQPIPAMIAGPVKHVSVRNRIQGYRRALAEYNLPYQELYMRWGDLDSAGGYEQMSALLELKTPPTAVFCCNDLTALGALEALRERGIAVPEECSIIGYDDIDMAAHSVPPLTTIRAEKELLGKQGVWHLLERIAEPTLAPRHTLIEGKLIERKTVQVRKQKP